MWARDTCGVVITMCWRHCSLQSSILKWGSQNPVPVCLCGGALARNSVLSSGCQFSGAASGHALVTEAHNTFCQSRNQKSTLGWRLRTAAVPLGVCTTYALGRAAESCAKAGSTQQSSAFPPCRRLGARFGGFLVWPRPSVSKIKPLGLVDVLFCLLVEMNAFLFLTRY